jgi:hypothetical protein
LVVFINSDEVGSNRGKQDQPYPRPGGRPLWLIPLFARNRQIWPKSGANHPSLCRLRAGKLEPQVAKVSILEKLSSSPPPARRYQSGSDAFDWIRRCVGDGCYQPMNFKSKFSDWKHSPCFQKAL